MTLPAASMFIIRDAVPTDGEAINLLCVEAYEEFRETIGEDNWQQMKQALAQASALADKGQLIVADLSSTVVGVVLYCCAEETTAGGLPATTALMRTLAVSTAHRGKGIGRHLTQECIERARLAGAGAIALTTAEMMTVARPMYERMGFIKEADLGERFGVKDARYLLSLK